MVWADETSTDGARPLMPRDDYAIAAGAIAYAALTGSAFAVDTADLTHVTGTGTAFLTEALPGRTIWLAAPVAEKRVVLRVTSDTELYVTQPFTVADIATEGQYLALSGLRELGIVDPRGSLQEYSREAPLGDGSVRGLGWPIALWTWTFERALVRDVLRAYVGAGRSQAVSIRTRTNSVIPGGGEHGPYAFEEYTAVMVWPIREEQAAGRAMQLEIKFQKLALIAPA